MHECRRSHRLRTHELCVVLQISTDDMNHSYYPHFCDYARRPSKAGALALKLSITKPDPGRPKLAP
eukprot:scaffold204405_cov37-Tisochrysis_lutea.AAC.3